MVTGEKKAHRKAVAIMHYFGNLSVNHYKFKGRFTRPEVKAWMEELGWILKTEHIETWNQPITVSIRGVFKNERSCPDLHNLLKVTCDALQALTGIDDRTYRTMTGDAVVDKKQDPHLVITIEEARN